MLAGQKVAGTMMNMEVPVPDGPPSADQVDIDTTWAVAVVLRMALVEGCSQAGLLGPWG
jgi:hypothetical protein